MSLTYSAISPVSAAVYTALNVAALTDLAPGGVGDVIPQGNVRPYVFFEVSNPAQHGGFGTYPGHGDVPELEVRIHAISDQPNVSEAQGLVAMAIGLLFEATLVVNGYQVCSDKPMPDIQIVNLGDQVIANVVVHEEVAIVRLIVENTGV